MKFLAQLPLARKLILTMMTTSTAALLVACVSFLIYDVVSLRHDIADHLKSLADSTGANVAAALTYNDPRSAELVLQALQAEPHIVAARVYDGHGSAFISYRRVPGRAPGATLPEHPPAVGSVLEQEQITQCRAIMFEGESIGSVYLISDLLEIQARRRRFIIFALILMAVSSAAAFLVAMPLKRLISRPIVELLLTTKIVSNGKNFAIRATKHADDEIGSLVDGFNEMLGEVEKRDASLISEVAERIRVEQALREQEQRQLLLDSTAEAIFGLDTQGRCTFANRACLQMLGYEKTEDLMGGPLHDLIRHSHRDSSSLSVDETRVRQVLPSGERTHVDDEVFWRADGTSFPVEYWSYPVWRDGKLVGSVATFIDITLRKLAEDALRAAHAESELFINSVPSILIGTDGVGQITRWNLTAARAFRLPADSVLGKPLQNCGITWLYPQGGTEVDSWFHVERSEKRENVMFEIDGHRRFLGLTIINVDLFTGGNGTGFLITGADRTEHKVMEEQLRQAQKLEAIGQLAAGIAHEINTPAQYIGDNARFLQETWLVVNEILEECLRLHEESLAGSVAPGTMARLLRCTEQADAAYLLREVPQAIAQTLEGVQRVSKIVGAMKEFSHPGSEGKSAIDINHSIETTIAVARNEWKYVADVKTSFQDPLPLVPCFGGEFNQVILNLLINAAHAIGDVEGDSGRKGKITITTKSDGGWVEVQIQDTGAGIPENVRPRIFEPFFTTKQVGKGTGQGLAIAHTVIVKKHGGQIWFESEVGKGTIFFIRLPQNLPETVPSTTPISPGAGLRVGP
jgi:PAS domain S-box-containing protein